MVLYLPDSGKMQLKDAIVFVFGNGRSIAPRADTKVGGEDGAVVVASNTTDFRVKDHEFVQACEFPDND